MSAWVVEKCLVAWLTITFKKKGMIWFLFQLVVHKYPRLLIFIQILDLEIWLLLRLGFLTTRDAKCQRAPVSEMFFDAISECPHVNIEEVNDGSIPTVPQILEPQESNGVTLTVPVPVMATQRWASLWKLAWWTANLLYWNGIVFCHSSKWRSLELWYILYQKPNNTSSFFYFYFLNCYSKAVHIEWVLEAFIYTIKHLKFWSNWLHSSIVFFF